MSITRNHRLISFECDNCGDAIETEKTDFDAAWTVAKEEGWRAIKTDEEWQHACPDCKSNLASW